MRHAILTTLAFCIIAASSLSLAVNNQQTQRIAVQDLGRQIQLIGRLGYPLGTMLTLDGTWRYPDQSRGPSKDYSIQFEIHTVNGKQLAQPLTLKTVAVRVTDRKGASQIPPYKRHAQLKGVSWSLRAYETGEHTASPAEYWQFRGAPTMAPQPAFTSSIVGYMATDQD